jgi:catalase
MQHALPTSTQSPPLAVPQFTFLFDDWGVPLNYRHMEGFGVHTFKLINKEGKETYCKFHWKPKCGEPGAWGARGHLWGRGC